MKKTDTTLPLLAVIILEGYAVLSAEMLAIRQSIPFVGSGTDTVSIIIAAVLMPLAFGYYAGGKYRPHASGASFTGVRNKLLFNIVVAQAIFTIGLSYYPLTLFFFGLIDAGIKNRLILTVLYSLIFLVTPVFLLGQTIPLISNYFSKERLSRITGRILFFSTMGSFAGAIFPSLVLMTTVGVGMSVFVLSSLMAVLTLLLSRRLTDNIVVASFFLAGFAFIVNSPGMMKTMHIVNDNKYNTVMVVKDDADNRHMLLNLTASSMYNNKGGKHKYIEFVERAVLNQIKNGNTPRDILVVGAGAFTFGLEDTLNNYDFVDLDGSLKKISEEYIIQQRLGPNKHFNIVEARAYLASINKKYDLIFLDAYNGDLTLPENLVTQEFFQTVKSHLKEKGVVVANYIVSPDFETPFSRHIDNTFRSVFPFVSRHVIEEGYKPWNDDYKLQANVIYIYRQHDDENPNEIYSDDKNRIFYDKPHSR